MEAVEDPTLAEIEAGCQEIQAGWTAAQKAARWVGGEVGWLAPLWAECSDQGELVPW